MSKLSSLKPKVAKLKALTLSAPATQRLTGSTGMKVRKRILKRDGYLCQECARHGRTTVADEVDHVVPLHNGGSNADWNQEAICRECHQIKSEREEKERRGL